MSEFAELRLLDPNLTTVHGILPFLKADLFLHLNETGSGSFETALDIDSAAMVEDGGFVDVKYRGAIRGGFFVENPSRAEINVQEEEGRSLAVAGPGALVILADGIVWTDGAGTNKRSFDGTQAGMLIALIEEAQTRGGLLNLSYDFTDAIDSDGVAWTDDFPLELTVGMSLLDVVRQIAKTGIDFEMLPNGSGGFVLSAYKDGLGSNKSTTVFFRVGVNCQEVSSDEAGGDVRNALLVKYKNGYTVVSDSTSITNRRRREKAVNYEYAQSSASAATLAGAELTLKKDPRKQISVKITDGKGPRVFEDYVLGDTITLDNKGEEAQYRIRGIHLSWNGDEFADVVVDLNSMILENEIRITQDVDWLMEMWKTAHDANLLETSFWAAIGDRGITYGVRDMLIVGDLLYVANHNDIVGYDNSLLIYNLASGGWQRVDLGINAPVALANVGSDVYIYSPFYLQKYNGSTLTTIADIEFVSNPSATVAYDIIAVGNKLYLAGNYSLIDGNAITGIAVYDTVAAAWTDIGEGATALGTDGTNVYTGIKMWNGSTWTTLGTFPATFGIITSVVPYDAGILVGTNYTGGIYYWDGSTWSLFGGGVNGYVYDIAVYLTDVYIIGTFTDAGSRVAKYSGGEWWMLDTGINGTGYSIVANDSDGNVDIYVGGPFTEAGGKPAQGIAAYYNNFEALADYLENTSGTFNLAEAIHSATAKSPIVAADEMGFWDSVSKQLRKISWTNILASIKAYTDGLYVALTGNQNVDGIKTFLSSPIVPTPTADDEAANKGYVDTHGGGGGTPGGSDTQIQYNDSGAFAGSAEFTVDPSGKTLYLGETATSSGVPSHGFNFDPTASTAHVLNTWGSGFASFFKGVFARGTKASPTAVQSGDVLVRYRGAGYDAVTGVGGAATNGEVRVVATENFDGTHHGADVEIHATPAGSTTLTKILSILGGGHVNIASGKRYQVDGAQHQHTISNITDPPIAETNANDIYAIAYPGTASGFTALINGDPTNVANSVVTFDTVTLGAVGTITPISTSQIGKLRLYNITRGNYALISTASGSTITMTSNVYALGWRNNDAITTVSQTVSGGVYTWHDVEITSGINGKTSIFMNLIFQSATVGHALRLHPFTASFSVSKYISLDALVVSGNSYLMCLYPMNFNVITFGWNGTPVHIYLREAGYLK